MLVELLHTKTNPEALHGLRIDLEKRLPQALKPGAVRVVVHDGVYLDSFRFEVRYRDGHSEQYVSEQLPFPTKF